MMNGKGKGGDKGKGKCKSGCGSRERHKPTHTGKAFMGVIKSFNEANNYGFIECDEIKAEFGNDVFAHGKELCGHVVGETVYFEVGVSHQGKPQALNVQTIDDPEPLMKKQRTGSTYEPDPDI